MRQQEHTRNAGLPPFRDIRAVAGHNDVTLDAVAGGVPGSVVNGAGQLWGRGTVAVPKAAAPGARRRRLRLGQLGLEGLYFGLGCLAQEGFLLGFLGFGVGSLRFLLGLLSFGFGPLSFVLGFLGFGFGAAGFLLGPAGEVVAGQHGYYPSRQRDGRADDEGPPRTMLSSSIGMME